MLTDWAVRGWRWAELLVLFNLPSTAAIKTPHKLLLYEAGKTKRSEVTAEVGFPNVYLLCIRGALEFLSDPPSRAEPRLPTRATHR